MSILTTIIEATRKSVARRRAARPVSQLEERIAALPPTRDFAGALRQPDLSFIAEIKRASPSKGWIRKGLNAAEIARQYEAAGARAVSVLTDEEFFRGSLEDLCLARAAVNLPLLMKDFVVETYQLYEARTCGADAVLLIAAVLSAQQLRALQSQAGELGLQCLVEVYEASEMNRIDWPSTQLLGVNNRNLHTFAVDINHSVTLLRRCPPHVVRVSESGLSDSHQLAHIHRHGIDAVLIGESFMRAKHPGRALEALRRLQLKAA